MPAIIRLGVRHAPQIAVDVARGLAYMHAKKAGAIIHRDLKPANLMISGSMYQSQCAPRTPHAATS